jgi:hypothetical protein
VSFLVEPQNQGQQLVSDLASKPLGRFFWFELKIGGDDFLVEPQNQGGRGFPGLDLKTGSYGLVIWASKSPRRFLGLGLKTKQPLLVYRLHHKTDGRVTVWDTCQDLAACFTWKQVWLGFPSLASRLTEVRRRVVHVAPSRMLRQSQVEDGWVDMMGCVVPCHPYFTVFFLLDPRGTIII